MIKQTINESSSRRAWFTGSAALLGAGALSSVVARAQMTPETVHDIGVLNFALRLENLQAAFYQQGLAAFAASDFQKSDAVQTMGSKIGVNIYSYLSGIAQDEQNHVRKLIETVYSLDGVPQAPECYNFGLTTPDNFLQMAQSIENLTVAAYTGAIIPQWVTSNSTIYNPAVQAQLATIATVQGRHAAFISLLTQAIPFPAAFDGTQSMAQIVSAIGPYLTTGCNAPPVPLTLAVAGAAKDSTVRTNRTTVPLDASLSSSATGQPLSYLWEIDLGSPASTIVNATAMVTSVILMGGAGVYSISLKVIDSLGGSDQDNIKIIYQP